MCFDRGKFIKAPFLSDVRCMVAFTRAISVVINSDPVFFVYFICVYVCDVDKYYNSIKVLLKILF
jgi:hypothetical protein